MDCGSIRHKKPEASQANFHSTGTGQTLSGLLLKARIRGFIMGLDGRGRTESEATGLVGTDGTDKITEIVATHFHEHPIVEAVRHEGNKIHCPCTVPRGYWYGMPLIHKRAPNILQLSDLIIIDVDASIDTLDTLKTKVYVRHVTCPHCGILYFKEERRDNSNQVREQLMRANTTAN